MSTVLVIDDTDEVREILRMTLSMEGYKVLSAGNGLEGCQKAQAHHPDLIICDLKMPILDGYQTLEKLRANPETSTIPFIFLTGHAEIENLRHGMRLGADDFLAKPFSPKELIEVVRVRLEKHKQLESESKRVFDELRSHFSLALPHELRTPLNGVIGYSEIIMEDIETLPLNEVQDLAKKINASGHRLLHLIENFMTYAQLEISGRDPEFKSILKKAEPCHISTTVEQAAEKLGQKSSRQADIKTALSEAWVSVFSEHLVKIVEEIVENALKFSTPGQIVSVTGEKAGMRYRICVEDHGTGMSEEQIHQIGPQIQFERRLHEQQGVGLGLVVARKLVELYDGDFEIKSQPTQGTRVTILLPLHSPCRKQQDLINQKNLLA